MLQLCLRVDTILQNTYLVNSKHLNVSTGRQYLMSVCFTVDSIGPIDFQLKTLYHLIINITRCFYRFLTWSAHMTLSVSAPRIAIHPTGVKAKAVNPSSIRPGIT